MFGLSLGMGKQNRKKAIEFAKDVVDNLQSVIITNPQKGDYLDQDKNGVWVNFPKPKVDVFKLMKTNEDLTAENTKLLKGLDKSKSELKKQRDTWDEFYPLLVDRNNLIQSELDKIKSTRLYKFFKWLGVW